MSIAVIDYGSGNLKSAAKALEVAVNNVNLSSKIVVTSDPKIIKQSDKIILPGQGSFRDCYLGIKKIPGLDEALNEFVLVKKKPIFGICVGMQLFAKIGYESQETKGFGWVDATVKKINNINKTLKLPHMGWNQIEFKKDFTLFAGLKNKSHMYFLHSYEFLTKQKDLVSSNEKVKQKTSLSTRQRLKATFVMETKSNSILVNQKKAQTQIK